MSEYVALFVSLVAAVSDVKTRRIPNALSIGLIIFSVIAGALTAGFQGAVMALALVVGVILTGSFAHASGWLGGGDVKLIAGCIACLGIQHATEFVLATAVTGGLLAIIIAMRERRMVAVLQNVAFGFVHGGGHVPTSAAAVRLPYAIAICCGVVTAIALPFMPFVRLPL